MKDDDDFFEFAVGVFHLDAQLVGFGLSGSLVAAFRICATRRVLLDGLILFLDFDLDGLNGAVIVKGP